MCPVIIQIRLWELALLWVLINPNYGNYGGIGTMPKRYRMCLFQMMYFGIFLFLFFLEGNKF